MQAEKDLGVPRQACCCPRCILQGMIRPVRGQAVRFKSSPPAPAHKPLARPEGCGLSTAILHAVPPPGMNAGKQWVPLRRMKKSPDALRPLEGETLLIDKPYGWTSFAVVAQVKKWMKAKVGHAGTLDPLASGLMILCTGPSTKTLGGLLGLDKEYTGIIRLGATTPTYDLESLPEPAGEWQGLSHEQIEAAIQRWTGAIEQIPPVHSAIKQDGKPVYQLARKGKEVVLKSRPVTIHAFELTDLQGPELHFRIHCSSGTYIRSLAHDVGQTLGCGAFLQSLRRTAIGAHRIEEAYTIEELGAYYGSVMNARIVAPKWTGE